MSDEINDDYIEELADYCLNHGTVGAGKSFGINSLIKKLPPYEQARLEKLNEQKRSDFIKRLKSLMIKSLLCLIRRSFPMRTFSKNGRTTKISLKKVLLLRTFIRIGSIHKRKQAQP